MESEILSKPTTALPKFLRCKTCNNRDSLLSLTLWSKRRQAPWLEVKNQAANTIVKRSSMKCEQQELPQRSSEVESHWSQPLNQMPCTLAEHSGIKEKDSSDPFGSQSNCLQHQKSVGELKLGALVSCHPFFCCCLLVFQRNFVYPQAKVWLVKAKLVCRVSPPFVLTSHSDAAVLCCILSLTAPQPLLLPLSRRDTPMPSRCTQSMVEIQAGIKFSKGASQKHTCKRLHSKAGPEAWPCSLPDSSR